MRKTFIAVLLACSCYVIHAQRAVFIPQVGVQTFRSDVSSNSPLQGYKAYSPLSPTIGGRLMYISKKGHGPYIGFHVGDLTISSYDSTRRLSTGKTLYRYEAGYQWLSKPIYFKRIWENDVSREQFENLERKGLAVQLQPSIGAVYTRGTAGTNSYSLSGTNYAESAYRGNIGINTGLGMIFSNNGKSFLSLSVNYSKGFGDLYKSNLHSGNTAAYQTTKASGWSFMMGVPITLFKKK